jgi:CRISPR-associated endonuclease/helicase Cas3
MIHTDPADTDVPDLNLWAKRGGLSKPYPLLCHLLDTAAAADVLWRHWLRPGLRDILTEAIAPGEPELARRRFTLVAGLHDVGKANAAFQGQTLSTHIEAWVDQFRDVLRDGGYEHGPDASEIPFDQALTCARRHEVVARRALGLVPEAWADPTETWPQAVSGGHHGRMHNYDDSACIIDETVSELCAGQWGIQQVTHIQTMLTAVALDVLPPALVGERSVALILATGLTSLADWFASDVVSVRAGQTLRASGLDPVAEPARWLEQRTTWLTSRLPQTFATYEPMADPRSQVLGEHADAPSPLQVDAEQVTAGMWVVTCPTGEGKTEAALLRHAAGTTEGLIFALPTRSTADAMMDRVRAAFEGTRNRANLSHAYAVLNEFYAPPQREVETSCEDHDGLSPSEWLSGRLMSLLAPVTVSTCDQVLAAGIRQRWSATRLLATANRHVVLDEVHTYDQYQSKILEGLLRWWGKTGTRVTLLSATLPTWQRNMFVTAYSPTHPAIEKAQARFPSHTIVTPGMIHDPELPKSRFTYDLGLDAQLVTSQVDDHVAWVDAQARTYPRARIGVVVNTVTRCVEVAEGLRVLGHDVLVLHSRMLAGHRDEVSRSLTRLIGKRDDATGHGQGQGVIVVGTQVIEASLDVDFDLMTSDLAPGPSLVQRAGRLWRHDDPRRTARVPGASMRSLRVIAAGTKTGALATRAQAPYLPGEQQRTLNALRVRPTLAVPADVQVFIDEAAFSWADAVSASGDLAPDAGAEVVEMMKRITAAQRVILPMNEYLARPSYAHLTVMTSRDDDVEAATRFTDISNATFILLDPTGATPYAWRHGMPELARTTDGTLLEEALRASIPANGPAYRALLAAHEMTTEVWRPRAALLRHLKPVDMRHLRGLTYSPTAGLIQGGPT